jgi:protein HOOK3
VKKPRPGLGGARSRRESHDAADDSFAVTGGGVGEELDDAVSGTTMTDLKLRIRKLERELKAAKEGGGGAAGDGNKLVVLENLLEDAQRMKKRYEGEYLKEHRETLLLKARMEEIMSGKSRLGDGYVFSSLSLPLFSSLCRLYPC